MSYFIFTKNSNNIEGTLYKIAENQTDLNNLNIIQSDYRIIEESEENFNSVKLGNKYINTYNENNISYLDSGWVFTDKQNLQIYINNCKQAIKEFTDNNHNHPLLSRWNNYYNQLNNLNLDSITYPLDKSLEQYFKDQNQISLNPLQIP
jgi:hypothetical protein